MSRVFIHRPVFAAVISIVIVLAGLIALGVLPIARYPEIAPPTIEVRAIYPGADAETVAETVAAPLEQEINGVEGMLYLSSVSSADGVATITVTFEVGTDLDLATVFVQNRVAIAEPGLPEEVKRQGVSVKKKSTEITLIAALSSPDGTYDGLFLSNLASLRFRDELIRVPGVGDVVVFGAGDYGMRIWIDPSVLDARGLTVSDVLAAVRGQNLQVAAGRIGAPPAPDGQVSEYVVSVRGRLLEASEFADIVVATDQQGRLVRLGDIARIELGAENYSQASRYNGSPCAMIAVYQLPGANAIAVVEGLRDRIETLRETALPPGAVVDISYVSTDVIEASIREVLITLFVALLLVIGTVYIFLQSFRATLIPAITIPVSLIGTLAVMLVFGFSINILTLFGLVLAIGIVVDDSIVIVENVTRLLDEEGLSPKEAALKSMEEVTAPVIATTLVLLSVFVPTAFLPGISGQMFKQFAITISIATLFSSINALTLSPALAAILLRPSPKRPLAPFRAFNGALAGVTTIYVALVRGLIRVAPLTFVIFVGVIGLALWTFARVPGGFIPQEDEGWCMVNVQLPDGASQQRTQEVLQRAERIAMDTPGVESVLGITGFSIVDGANASNAGTVFVIFEDWDERGTPERSQAGIIRRINAGLSSIEEAIAFAFPLPSLPGMGASGGLAAQIEDRSGAGLAALAKAVNGYLADAAGQPGLAAARTTFRTNSPRLFVDIDRESIISRGVPLQDVFETIGASLGSSYVNDFTLAGRQFQVRIQAEAEARDEAEDIGRLKVRNAQGEMVPIGAVAEIVERVGPTVMPRFNVYPSAKVSLTPAPDVTQGQAIEIGERLAETSLPDGFEMEWTELAFQAKRAGGATAVFALAVLLVYLVLAAQYESWTLPLSVILAVPTAILGAALALLLLKMDNNLYTQIGIVLLIGLSAKSSILIVEFAKERRSAGRSPRDAALDAARLRFRAILMTAFSFILGVLPLLIASGAGAVSRRAIGATVFGGMLVGCLVSLIFVPPLYFVVQKSLERLRPSAAEPKAT